MAASKSAVSTRRRPMPSRARAVTPPNSKVKPLEVKTKGLASPANKRTQNVPILPSSQSEPMWLRRLCALQRQSTVLTFLLVAATLALYGWTVYSQQVWSQAYRKLVNLQRDERQLTTASEGLKNQMALQAEQPAMGLVPPNPATAIFLQPAPQRPAPAANSSVSATTPAAQTQQSQSPLGY